MTDLTLHPYQQEDRDFLIDHPRAGLVHTMGLGKTAVTLAALHELMWNYFTVQQTLIIAPLNAVLISWPGELRKWSQFKDFSFTVLHGDDKELRLRQRKDIYIINYEGLEWLRKVYKGRHPGLPRFQMTICDESTYAKNVSSIRHRRTKKITEEVDRAVILTGTPSPNGYLDLYGQMELLQPGMLARTYTSYKNAYFIPPANGTGKWFPRQGIREIIANKMSPFIRVRGKECLNRDEPTFNTIYCELPESKRAEYEELENELFLKLKDGSEIEIFNASSLSMKLRQYVSGFLYKTETNEVFEVHQAKLDALKELVESLNGDPLLCAIQFRYEIDIIRRALGKDVPAIYGDTSAKERRRIVEEWNHGKYFLLLVNSASVSHALNMQDGGSNFLWYSLPWALDIAEQCQARIDRQGQREPVILHSLIVRDTIDEIMQSRLKEKKGSERALLERLKELRDARTNS